MTLMDGLAAATAAATQQADGSIDKAKALLAEMATFDKAASDQSEALAAERAKLAPWIDALAKLVAPPAAAAGQ